MELIQSGQELEKLIIKLIDKHKKLAFAVAWASAETKVFQHILKNVDKIKYGAIGTHFYQTDPAVLNAFIGSNQVKFVLQPNGVFHPKVYYFQSKTDTQQIVWDIIIGSANMTSGAFNKNSELSVHLSSEQSVFNQQETSNEAQQILREMWHEGKTISLEDATKYQKLYTHYRRKRQELLGASNYISKQTSPLDSSLLTMSWNNYQKQIWSVGSTQERLHLLEVARSQFNSVTHFKEMSLEWRQALAGIINNHSENRIKWHWFGDMRLPKFYGYYITNKEGKYAKQLNIISDALDSISLEGKVYYEDYHNYIVNMEKAFSEEGGLALATATRLLCIKRPDVFVTCNQKSSENICNNLGISDIYNNKEKYELYWNEVIAPIQGCLWCDSRLSKKHSIQEEQLWKSRVAMLDVLFY